MLRNLGEFLTKAKEVNIKSSRCSLIVPTPKLAEQVTLVNQNAAIFSK
jgi:hypothetical protein